MKAYEILLKYVVVRTPSDETSDTVPSSKCQFSCVLVCINTQRLRLSLLKVDGQGLPDHPGH